MTFWNKTFCKKVLYLIFKQFINVENVDWRYFMQEMVLRNLNPINVKYKLLGSDKCHIEIIHWNNFWETFKFTQQPSMNCSTGRVKGAECKKSWGAKSWEMQGRFNQNKVWTEIFFFYLFLGTTCLWWALNTRVAARVGVCEVEEVYATPALPPVYFLSQDVHMSDFVVPMYFEVAPVCLRKF